MGTWTLRVRANSRWGVLLVNGFVIEFNRVGGVLLVQHGFLIELAGLVRKWVRNRVGGLISIWVRNRVGGVLLVNGFVMKRTFG